MIYNLLPSSPSPPHTHTTLATVYLIHMVLLEDLLTVHTCFTIGKMPIEIPSQPTFLSLLNSGVLFADTLDTFVVHGLGKGC